MTHSLPALVEQWRRLTHALGHDSTQPRSAYPDALDVDAVADACLAAFSTPAPVALPPHPIATAPKDGTRVLLWRDGWEFAPISWWDGRVGGWQIDGSLHGLCCPPWATSTAEAMPTHWVPLPEVIGAKKGQG
jgi:hypothetical protein